MACLSRHVRRISPEASAAHTSGAAGPPPASHQPVSPARDGHEARRHRAPRRCGCAVSRARRAAASRRRARADGPRRPAAPRQGTRRPPTSHAARRPHACPAAHGPREARACAWGGARHARPSSACPAGTLACPPVAWSRGPRKRRGSARAPRAPRWGLPLSPGPSRRPPGAGCGPLRRAQRLAPAWSQSRAQARR